MVCNRVGSVIEYGQEMIGMEYSLAPLIVRVVFLALIGVVLAVVLFFCSKKQKKATRIFMCVAAASLGFVMSISSIFALIKPQIKTITCTFMGYSRAGDTLNPFSIDGEFLCDGTRVWIELDTVTQSKVLGDVGELEVGETYVVTYEVNEKLILGVDEP